MRDWAALRAAWRFTATPPAWTDSVPLTEACVPWMVLVPEALKVTSRLGWRVSTDGRCISRMDDLGVQRTVCVGWDSIGVLRQWLISAHQLAGIHRCGRVAASLHRDDVTCARGLALAKPAASQRYALSGHQVLAGPGPLAVRRAALATAGSGWYWNASLRLPKGDTVCMCKGRNPSRPHLTWVCPHTAHCRLGLEQPTDRVSERLFAAPLHEWPCAPPALAQEEFVADLATHCRQLWNAQGHLIAATDGSSFEGVGAFAVVTDRESFATGDSSEDQSAFRQEALAFLALFRALCTVVPLPAGRVTVLYDLLSLPLQSPALPSCLAYAPSWLHYGQPCKHVVAMWSSYGSLAMISRSPGPLPCLYAAISAAASTHLQTGQPTRLVPIVGALHSGAPGLRHPELLMIGSSLPFVPLPVLVKLSRTTCNPCHEGPRPLLLPVLSLPRPCAMTPDPES